MVRQIRFVLVLGGNGLVVVSALLSLLVYFSGEPSGLQYMFLVPAAALAGLAALGGGALGLMTLKRPVAWANLALAIGALLVTAPCWDYARGNLLETIGAVVLLPLAPFTTVAVIRRLGYEECSL